jgi:hypothetical protein
MYPTHHSRCVNILSFPVTVYSPYHIFFNMFGSIEEDSREKSSSESAVSRMSLPLVGITTALV